MTRWFTLKIKTLTREFSDGERNAEVAKVLRQVANEIENNPNSRIVNVIYAGTFPIGDYMFVSNEGGNYMSLRGHNER